MPRSRLPPSLHRQTKPLHDPSSNGLHAGSSDRCRMRSRMPLRFGVSIGVSPTPRCSSKGSLVLGPIVECGGIEVSAARPYDRVYLRIERDLSKSSRVAQGTIKLALENSAQINGPAQAIVESQAQGVGLDALDRCDSVNRVIHGVLYCNGAMGEGLRPCSRSCRSESNSCP